MRRYVLSDHDRTTIARRPLTITVSGGGSTSDVTLEAYRDGSTDVDARIHTPGIMVLRRIDGRTVVRAVPAENAALFPTGMRLTLTVRTEQPRELDGDVVVVHAVDVSGFRHRDLVEIDVADAEHLEVRALRLQRDIPLGPLSSAARALARGALGRDRVAEPADLIIAVDTSASMAPLLADGSVAAALDVLVGLTDVLAWERDLVSYLLTDGAVRLPAAAPAEVTTRTVEALGEAGLGCGFRCAPPELTPRRRAVTYVVTDAVPADAERLAAARGPDDMRHLVLVGASGIPALGELPCTALPAPPQGVDPARYLEQNHMALGAVVESLLADIPRRAA